MPQPMKVLAQRQLEKVLHDGEVHSVVNISLLVGRFGPFQLDVPVDEYNQENVVALARDLEYHAITIAGAIEQLHLERPSPQTPGRPPPPEPPKPPPPPAL